MTSAMYTSTSLIPKPIHSQHRSTSAGIMCPRFFLTQYIRPSTAHPTPVLPALPLRHTHNNRYLENGACVTMSDIYHARIDSYTQENKGPVFPFDETTQEKTANVTGSWYLESSLFVTEGSRLLVQGELLSLGSTPEQVGKREQHTQPVLAV